MDRKHSSSTVTLSESNRLTTGGNNTKNNKHRSIFYRIRPRVVSIFVTTSHPSSCGISTSSSSSSSVSGTNNNNGGAIAILDPRSGMIQSSTRISSSHSMNDMYSNSNDNPNKQIGISHVSFFPSRINTNDEQQQSQLAIAYGCSSTEKNDSYGILLSIYTSSTTAAAAAALSSTGTTPGITNTNIIWKCRLPESKMTGGLLVSPITSPKHIFGGGSSGTIYVWDTSSTSSTTNNINTSVSLSSNGGSIIRTIPNAHYRSITCMIWSSSSSSTTSSTISNPYNTFLCTGGADGIVHVFSHIDLVEQQSIQSSTKVHPIRSYSKHTLSVTALVAMNNGSRLISSGDDGLLVIMELSSNTIIATIQLPNPIRTMCFNTDSTTYTTSGLRLYAGSSTGMIHMINLDNYALYKSVQLGATLLQIPTQYQQCNNILSIEDQVFGTHMPGATNSVPSTGMDTTSSSTMSKPYYENELRGHDRAITSLAIYDDDNNSSNMNHDSDSIFDETNYCEYLVSGDEGGTIRIWDIYRKCCIRIVYPWQNNHNKSTASIGHPITAIRIIRDTSNPFHNHDDIAAAAAANSTAIFGGTTTKRNNKRIHTINIMNMIAPLQKFMNQPNDTNCEGTTKYNTTMITVPYIEPQINIEPSSSTSSLLLTPSSNVTINESVLQRALRSHHVKQQKRRRQEQQQNEPSIMDTTNDQHGNDNENDIISSMKDKYEKDLQQLQQQLDEAKQTIGRWEMVNNKLLLQINQQQQQQQPKR